MPSYMGQLAHDDPLYGYLRSAILPQYGYDNGGADFSVFGLAGSHGVYLYEEWHSGIRLVGKFFGGNGRSWDDARRSMEREFGGLHLLRERGLSGWPHEVVRPLGRNADLDCVLVEQFGGGTPFSHYLETAVKSGQTGTLYAKLSALAYFLATWHNRTANGAAVDFNSDCDYLDRLVRRLVEQGVASGDDAQELYWLRDRWREQPRMWQDQQVILHGDATPPNFLFGDGIYVMAIDLERLRVGDRVFDVGRIAGELQHAFMLTTGDKYAAEPLIGHFLWEYACHFPDRDRAFAAISGRVAFQMAATLLRIARNSWIEWPYRRRLVAEARLTLRTF